METKPQTKQKKHLPERLREALKQQQTPYNESNDAPRLEEAELTDPFSAERRMLDEILGGGLSARARPSVAQPQDLVAQMAQRLSAAERASATLAAERDAALSKLAASELANGLLRRALGEDASREALEDECAGLRRELSDVLRFLDDYGLVWVGGQHEPGSDQAATGAVSDEPPSVDVARLVERLRELTQRARGDRPELVTEGRKAQFKHKEGERIAVYSDGILIRNGPFRKYESETARPFVRDVLDGYFPGEFKESYPAGVPFDVVDRRDERFETHALAFAGAGRALGRKARTLADMGESQFTAETFLGRLPKTVVKNGRILDLRDDVRARLLRVDDSHQASAAGADARADACANARDARAAACARANAINAQPCLEAAEVPRVTVAALQIKGDDGHERFLLTLRCDATLADLRREIDAKRGSTDEYEIRTAFPNRAYNDLNDTLQTAGLVPNATLLLQRV